MLPASRRSAAADLYCPGQGARTAGETASQPRSSLSFPPAPSESRVLSPPTCFSLPAFLLVPATSSPSKPFYRNRIFMPILCSKVDRGTLTTSHVADVPCPVFAGRSHLFCPPSLTCPPLQTPCFFTVSELLGALGHTGSFPTPWSSSPLLGSPSRVSHGTVRAHLLHSPPGTPRRPSSPPPPALCCAVGTGLLLRPTTSCPATATSHIASPTQTYETREILTPQVAYSGPRTQKGLCYYQ